MCNFIVFQDIKINLYSKRSYLVLHLLACWYYIILVKFEGKTIFEKTYSEFNFITLDLLMHLLI